MKKISIYLAFIVFLFSIFSLQAKAEDSFNPNYIISDAEMLNYSSMDVDDVQNFLKEQGSFLANYTCTNAYGTPGKTAAEIIYDAANNNYDCEGVSLSSDVDEAERVSKCKPFKTISPKAILVLLQKEMSLIEDPSPSQRQLDWATGYGCPDGSSCSPRWKGFGKQVNSAALQFKHYMDNFYDYERGEDIYQYTYKKGGTYTFSNPYASQTENQKDIIVTIYNQATAALYNYTPHVYNGNYNFYKLWNKYFTQKYPDGSLLQAEGEPGVWLIQNGKKRPFLSSGALKSRFDTNKIIIVSKSVLASYEKGNPIKFPNYSIIRSPAGDLYLLVDNLRRKFANHDTFRRIGYNPEEIVGASWQDIKSYDMGAPITASSTYPTGALLQNKESGGVYWVYDGTKAPLLDRVFLDTKFKNQTIIPVEPGELANYKKVEPVKFESGELLSSYDSPAVYLLSEGKKRAFISGKIFLELGYKWENIINVPQRIIDLYPNGEAIKNQL